MAVSKTAPRIVNCYAEVDAEKIACECSDYSGIAQDTVIMVVGC
jgi:hypothetical protein